MHEHFLAAVLQLAGGPSVTPAPPPFGSDLQKLLSWASWMASGACTLGVLIVAGTMALRHQRGEAGQHMAGLFWVLFGLILIASSTALVGAFGT
jgi:hypothetical protein